MSGVAAVVLAAGSSARFGRDKLVEPLDGKPLVMHVVEAALAARLVEVVVVVRSLDDPVVGLLPERSRLRPVANPDHRSGMSTSLKRALEALHPSVDAALVLLGDEPEVTKDAIDAVVDAFESSDAAAMRASYRGRLGHPVVLGRAVWPQVLQEEGDRGARRILDSIGAVEVVPIDASQPADVDTEEDLNALRERLSRT